MTQTTARSPGSTPTGHQERLCFVLGGLIDVRLRIKREASGRYAVDSPHAVADSLSATDLRSIPLGRIGTVINAPMCRAAMDDPATQVALSPFVVETSLVEAAVADLPYLEAVPASITVPSGRSRPDAFYEQVVNAYVSAYAQTDSPVEALMAGAGVGRATVHGWLREARSRGLTSSDRA